MRIFVVVIILMCLFINQNALQTIIKTLRRIFQTLMLLLAALLAEAQTLENKNAIQTTDSAFFTTSEAHRIGDQLLVFQRETGGWPKNVNMVKPLTEEERTQVLAEKGRQDDSTIDNKATITQIAFLARLYLATKDERYKESFLKGMEFLLGGQYDNGGWPQFWPKNRDYQVHITYNDNAMVNVMKILNDARQRKAPYTAELIDNRLQQRCQQAFDKGVECILNTQIVVDGEPTVWCQQYDRVTLQPAKARSYELPSFVSAESASLMLLLMQISNPNERVKRAVEGAMRWFEAHKLTGIRVEKYEVNRRSSENQPSSLGVGRVTKEEGETEGKTDIRVVADPTAPPLWARFYDLEEGRPFFCDRDGQPKRDIQDIGYERRNGYSWYSNSPADLFKRYETWKKKYHDFL